MGRKGGGRGSRAGPARDDAARRSAAFFNAVLSEKTDTLVWSLRYGNLTLTSRDDDGCTAIIVAAGAGKVRSLQVFLRFVREQRDTSYRREALDATDEDGRSALMLAVEGGHLECVQELREGGASLSLRDVEGHSAHDYARARHRQDLLDALDGKEQTDDSTVDSATESEGGFEGETSTQRSRRKKRERAQLGFTPAARRAAELAGAQVSDPTGDDTIRESPVARAGVVPVMPEVAAALQSCSHELTLSRIERPAGITQGELDPALWLCGSLNRLEVCWQPGLAVGSLGNIGALSKLLTLIVRNSCLPELPEALGDLRDLKSLEVDGNELCALPHSIGQLSALESLSANRNKIQSARQLAPLVNLVSLALSHNHLRDLDALDLSHKPRLASLTISHNELIELPDSIGDLAMLQHLDVSANLIAALPLGMSRMKEKKLTELVLHDNPFKDGKIRSMIERSAVLSKDVLTYLRKQGPQKGVENARGKKIKQVEANEVDNGKELASTGAIASPCSEGCRQRTHDAAPEEDEAALQAAAERRAQQEETKRLLADEARLARKEERKRLEAAMKAKATMVEHSREQEAAHRERREAERQAAAALRDEAKALARKVEEERRATMSHEELMEEQAALEARKAAIEAEQDAAAGHRKTLAQGQAAKNTQKAEERSALQVDESRFKYVFHHGAMHKVRIDPGPNCQLKHHSVGGNRASGGGVGGGCGGVGSGGGGIGVGNGRQSSGNDEKELNSGRPGRVNRWQSQRREAVSRGLPHHEGTIDVPVALVGRLIGAKGANIKKLCADTGARVDVRRNEEAAGMVPVDVSGDGEAVSKALERIQALLSAV